MVSNLLAGCSERDVLEEVAILHTRNTDTNIRIKYTEIRLVINGSALCKGQSVMCHYNHTATTKFSRARIRR